MKKRSVLHIIEEFIKSIINKINEIMRPLIKYVVLIIVVSALIGIILKTKTS
jgi:hypothetical protein